MPVLLSGVTTVQIGRKILDFIRYLFMEQTTRRKKSKKKVGWLCSTEAGKLEANQILGFVFEAFPRQRLHSEVLGLTGHNLQRRLQKDEAGVYITLHYCCCGPSPQNAKFHINKKMVWTEEQHTLIEKDHLGDWSPEKDCCWWSWLTFRQPLRKTSSESSGSFSQLKIQKPWWAIYLVTRESSCW